MVKISTNRNSPRGLKSNNSKLRKFVALLLVMIVAGVGAYTIFFAKADTLDDSCSGGTYTVFMNNDCIKIIKSMANNITGNHLDTNNGGFDGPLNDQLIGLNGVAFFVNSGCGAYEASAGVNTCMYKAMKAQVIKNTTPAPAPAAPAPTPTPAAPAAPADNPTPCKDQQITVGSSGDCVKLLNTALNVVFKKCYNKDANTGSNAFGTDSRDALKWSAAAGNLGDEAKNNIGTLFANDKVSSRLWDIIFYLVTYYNNGNKCVGTSATAAPAAPTPTKQPTPKAPKKATPTTPLAAPPAPVIDCSASPLKIGSTGPCVLQLKYYLVVLAPDVPPGNRDAVKTQIGADNDKFSKALDDYLRYTINVTSVVSGLAQGSYNGTVTDVIWNHIKLSAQFAAQTDATNMAKAIKEQTKVDKQNADAATKAARDKNLADYATAVQAVQEGDPTKLSVLPRAYTVSLDFEKDGKNPVFGANDGGITQGKTGYCVVILYPGLDDTSTFWTFASYESYQNNDVGVCSVKQSVRNAGGGGFRNSWVGTNSYDQRISQASVEALLPGLKTSNKAFHATWH